MKIDEYTSNASFIAPLEKLLFRIRPSNVSPIASKTGLEVVSSALQMVLRSVIVSRVWIIISCWKDDGWYADRSTEPILIKIHRQHYMIFIHTSWPLEPFVAVIWCKGRGPWWTGMRSGPFPTERDKVVVVILGPCATVVLKIKMNSETMIMREPRTLSRSITNSIANKQLFFAFVRCFHFVGTASKYVARRSGLL